MSKSTTEISDPTKRKEIIKAFNRKWWRFSILLALAILTFEITAKFYYSYSAQNQKMINTEIVQEILKLDKKIKEIAALDKYRSKYYELLSIKEGLQEARQDDLKFLSQLFSQIPFEWSIKQINFSAKQTILIIETTQSTHVKQGIARLTSLFQQYQVDLIEEEQDLDGDYLVIKLSITKSDNRISQDKQVKG